MLLLRLQIEGVITNNTLEASRLYNIVAFVLTYLARASAVRYMEGSTEISQCSIDIMFE